MSRRSLGCLEGFRHALEARIDLLKRLSFLPGGFAPWTPFFFVFLFFQFSKNEFGGITKSEFGEKNGTMFQSSKNSARWWSSFVCSLRIDPFRDFPGTFVTKPVFMGGTPPHDVEA